MIDPAPAPSAPSAPSALPAFPEPTPGPRRPLEPSPIWRWIFPLPPRGKSGPAFFLRWIVLRILLCYLLICLMLAFLQRSMIYHQTRAERIAAADEPLPPGMLHDVTVPSSAGTLHGWHMLPWGEFADSREECDQRLSEARLVVMYFSGNAGNRTYRTSLMEVHARLGAHVFLIDYRGYGENPGSPSEAALVEDAEAVWKMLTEERGVPASKIVLYGESLGGGVATRLASNLCQAGSPPAGLILTATFSSLGDTAAAHFPWLPVRWLLLDTFRSEDAVKDVACPILQFHGTQDSIIPIALGKKLFAAAPSQSASGAEKQFVELQNADHNDIFLVASGKIKTAIGAFFHQLAK